MGSIRKKTFAKVKPPKGRAVTFPMTTGIDGLPKIVVTSATFVAKFRDGSGIIHNEQSRPADAMKARLGQSWPNWNAGRNS